MAEGENGETRLYARHHSLATSSFAVMTLDSQFLLSNRTSHFDCHTYENLTILKKFQEMHGFFYPGSCVPVPCGDQPFIDLLPAVT